MFVVNDKYSKKMNNSNIELIDIVKLEDKKIIQKYIEKETIII